MARETNRLMNTTILLKALGEAIGGAIGNGMSLEDVKACLERAAELLDEE